MLFSESFGGRTRKRKLAELKWKEWNFGNGLKRLGKLYLNTLIKYFLCSNGVFYSLIVLEIEKSPN